MEIIGNEFIRLKASSTNFGVKYKISEGVLRGHPLMTSALRGGGG